MNKHGSIKIIILLVVFVLILFVIIEVLNVLSDEALEKPVLSILSEKVFEIEAPEEILYQFTTTGEWKESFKPQLFLKVTDTDLSRCFIDGRLRVDLNGEIYWIRLEEE